MEIPIPVSKKEILIRARDVLAEIDSYSELEQVLETKLYSGPSPSPIRMREETMHTSCKEAELIDKINACITKLRVERNTARELVQRAAEIIDDVKGGDKRAALRYYFLCRKSAAKIADIIGRDIRTVQRWIESPF